ncbi:hypothetical protein NDU88_002077 [Pleurodeles waltl]|uniref:Uncharacterized protein n=1 Tax=Pleurodeles waltl TaxID=8319 RepID=A0AAV7U8M8_PLEWA|nr:hypothetical protein NDU88_002077 [Pleurodeles waltl]
MQVAEPRPPIPASRLQPTALEDVSFREALSVTVAEFRSCNEGTATQRGMELEAFKVVVRGHYMGKTKGIRVHEEEGREGRLLSWLVHPNTAGP